MLNALKLKPSDKIPTNVAATVKLFPSNQTAILIQAVKVLILHSSKHLLPLCTKLPSQQAMLPQENPFDINSELIPYQDKEVEAVFKAPELEDFLLPPILGDQITDSTLMHIYLPKQADIDRIMEQINRRYLSK